eukprot:TRINITY_DN1545_c0_g1_i2.p1 TRINITY_DN1545_c0_g1~~TRINITY_DN1545_c0_g1_i2.p1  ORF type:complete len:466 (-),score=47.91 TRINITY_DN1545_c0_g1_i2:17-1414(-)
MQVDSTSSLVPVEPASTMPPVEPSVIDAAHLPTSTAPIMDFPAADAVDTDSVDTEDHKTDADSESDSGDQETDFDTSTSTMTQTVARRPVLPDIRPDVGAVIRLGIAMDKRFKALVPPAAEYERKMALLNRLKNIVRRLWRDYNVDLHLFGSSASDLCLVNGDVDLCLTIDRQAGTRKRLVVKLANTLKRQGMKNVVSLLRARVPIVKFDDPTSRLSCDICINNVLALHNTRMLAVYMKIDRRARVMAYIVKHWAKQREMNDPYMGSLSSYAWVLLVINFLQRRDPPVLPCLQRHPATCNVDELPKVLVRGHNCYFYNDLIRLRAYGDRNNESLGVLLFEFFRHYALHFDYAHSVVSIRTARLLDKQEKSWDKPSDTPRDNHHFSIEDPFDLDHDLGRVIDPHSLRDIQAEFERGFTLLSHNADLEHLCLKYIPPAVSAPESAAAAAPSNASIAPAEDDSGAVMD